MRLSAAIVQQLDECEKHGMVFHPCDATTRRTLLRHADKTDGELFSPYRSFYARRSWWGTLNPLQRDQAVICAVSRQHPSWVFCGVSAAILQGLCGSYFLVDGKVHIVTTYESHKSSNQWVVRHHVDAKSALEIDEAHGVPVTPVERTVFDCARLLRFRDALGIVDAALRRGYRRERLLDFCAQNRYYRWSSRALVTISYGDGLSENGGESFARAQMIALGYEPPQLQVNFWDPIKKRNSRVDYLWKTPTRRVIVFELHGNQKYLDPQMTEGLSIDRLLSAERKRASRLSLHGVVVNDIDMRDCYRISVLRRQLEEYGVPHRSGATPGFVEFNRQSPLPEARNRYPPPMRVW